MSLAVLRLLFDSGLLILIWMTQLIVYPSFRFYHKEMLLHWHQKYTKRITGIVMPLMLGQLMLVSYQLWQNTDWYTSISFSIILIIWGLTFLLFIPLHNKIAYGQSESADLEKLVDQNWIRTFLWTVVFLMSFLKMLFS